MSRRVPRIVAWGDVGFCIAFAAWAAWLRHTQWNLRCWIGAAVALTGLALWITARRQLGASFSLAAKARTLVSTGLYSKFRHPVYYFGFVAWLGVLLIVGRLVPLLFFLALYTALEAPRMVNENRVLEDAFGEEYRLYKARTWF